MSWREFIKTNRAEIDSAIRAIYQGSLNDEDRKEHILNDEGLYLWAKSEGVNV